MADPRGFMKAAREVPVRRPVEVRITDWREVYEAQPRETTARQASRCMDCGIPFCHNGCPLANLIPEWNDLVRGGDWVGASDRLHATNNFPEFTGRLCPAPCETACVLGIGDDPVTIKNVEAAIADHAWDAGAVTPVWPRRRTGRSVAVVGSGPAGLAAAQQLTRAGHDVVVYERADRAGGLLRYGIPEFKLEKHQLDRRLAQMRVEGTTFRTGVEVGRDLSPEELRAGHDAVVLAVGSTVARDLPVPGRELAGVHQAMEYLTFANRVQAGDLARSPLDAAARAVVVIGGGDTGADCVGTAHRQGAASVTQLEILPVPPEARPADQPWPTYPMTFRVQSAHEEGGERLFAVSTQAFLPGNEGRVRALELADVTMIDGRPEVHPGTIREIPADLVLLAMGFVGPEREPLLDALGVRLAPRGTVARDGDYATDVDGVFVAGDAGRGQSLVVWAIAEGRSCAAAVDRWLGGEGTLPTAVAPTAMPLTVAVPTSRSSSSR